MPGFDRALHLRRETYQYTAIHLVGFTEHDARAEGVHGDAAPSTVNVPYRGTVDVIIDFTDPVIKGMSVFHCHLLNHEDKGMMAKILIK